MKLKLAKDLKDVFQYEIIPLLKEYFYEDWEKLCLVLGRKFVIIHIGKLEVTFSAGYEDTYEDYKDKNIYRISDPDTWNQLTFKSIYEG